MAGKAFNVGSNDENYTKKMIAEEIAAQMPLKVDYVQKVEDPRDYKVNFDRIKALGFVAEMRLPDGIREVAEAIRQGLDLRSLCRPEIPPQFAGRQVTR